MRGGDVEGEKESSEDVNAHFLPFSREGCCLSQDGREMPGDKERVYAEEHKKKRFVVVVNN